VSLSGLTGRDDARAERVRVTTSTKSLSEAFSSPLSQSLPHLFVSPPMKAVLVFLIILATRMNAQSASTGNATSNPLLCDPVKGSCELPSASPSSAMTSGGPEAENTVAKELVTVEYFTDPICSSCWGIEPQLRRWKLEYGHALRITYRMGGLLPDWSYNSGGISKPSDVAAHWDEVSGHYDMPIDGDVWLTDPLPSSYPPSIAFKAAQLQDAESAPVVGTVMNAAAHEKTNAAATSPSIHHAPKALAFLRVLREMVFLHKKNITKPEVIADAARAVQLDPERLLRDMEGTAKHLFEEDLRVARTSGVRGFPTIILRNAAGATRTIYGAQPYERFASALRELVPGVTPRPYDTTWQSLFATYPTLTAKEYAVLSGTPRERSEELLNTLVAAGNMHRFDTKNGSMWSVVR
jgi:putative protein-disulfide isomerase